MLAPRFGKGRIKMGPDILVLNRNLTKLLFSRRKRSKDRFVLRRVVVRVIFDNGYR